MSGVGHDLTPSTSRVPAPATESRADRDEIALVAAGFPRYRLWREHLACGTRYVARARDLDAHPHTLVTASLAELANELTASRQATAK